ncbi:unnamed protein product [Ceratitis capitata]|uniref:(Mediterranean fruit fly) hypothetical protein n=1 Tax=Ceratitis capitata TaxID=7213 RepID=A0A811UNY2_CERCA|nr:unnamed protein product [Ceratitis capitata]
MSVEAANKPMDKWRADGRVRGDNGDNGTGSQLRVGNWCCLGVGDEIEDFKLPSSEAKSEGSYKLRIVEEPLQSLDGGKKLQ